MARQMKYSGIVWIGEIPETWTISKNKYLLDSMYSGGTPSASNSEFYAEAEGTPFTVFATHIIEVKREKKENIRKLQDEVAKLKSELKSYADQEAANRAIDKSDGSLYIEYLPNAKIRVICGFCWEERQTRIPLVPEWHHGYHEQYEVCKCPMCGRYCRGKDVFVTNQAETAPVEVNDLPF